MSVSSNKSRASAEAWAAGMLCRELSTGSLYQGSQQQNDVLDAHQAKKLFDFNNILCIACSDDSVQHSTAGEQLFWDGLPPDYSSRDIIYHPSANTRGLGPCTYLTYYLLFEMHNSSKCWKYIGLYEQFTRLRSAIHTVQFGFTSKWWRAQSLIWCGAKNVTA